MPRGDRVKAQAPAADAKPAKGAKAGVPKQVGFCRDRGFPYRRLRVQGGQGRGRVRMQAHYTSYTLIVNSKI